LNCLRTASLKRNPLPVLAITEISISAPDKLREEGGKLRPRSSVFLN